MPVRYCIWSLALLFVLPVRAMPQQSASEPPASASTGYTVFVHGTPIGHEEVTVQPGASGLTITSTGRLSAPVNRVTRRAEVRYRPDWTPEYLIVEAIVDGGDTTLKTTFSGSTAMSTGSVAGQDVSHTGEVSGQPFVLPRFFFGAYAAIAQRLGAADEGSEYRGFQAPQAPELTFRLSAVSMERMQTGAAVFDVRRYVLLFGSPVDAMEVNLYADDRGTLLRIYVPAQALDVVRDDLAASTSRAVEYSNPGDEPAIIPSSGFNLGATLTRPAAGPARVPAVILVGSPDIGGRDAAVAGVPIHGQLAGALADAGFLAVRYDSRGYGQSGGRVESATFGDYADDVRAIVKWLADRRDVDRRRIAVLGHGEGAWVALLAAARERRIAAVVAIGTPSTTGAEFVLEQQRRDLEQMNASPEDREAKIDLQKRINTAVMTGKWEGIPDDIRSRADMPWFQSLLAFDPAKVLERVRQPLLFVHGELDREVLVEHADRIAGLARTRSDSKSVSVVNVVGVNHLLVPAVTGELGEYPSLSDKNISEGAGAAITDWLAKTFASVR